MEIRALLLQFEELSAKYDCRNKEVEYYSGKLCVSTEVMKMLGASRSRTG